MSERIIVARDAGIMRLVFNRPEKKNALDRGMYQALIAALAQAAADDSLRVVTFFGAGGDFTAGNDLADFQDFIGDTQAFPALAFVRALAAFPKPMVAAVTGDAIGVGATMLFHCDLVYASAEARLRTPFIDLGLVPEAGASLLVPRRLGMAKATQMLLLGDAIDGAEALRLGLVNALAPAVEVVEMAMDAARRLAQKPARALRQSRRLMRGDPQEILARIDEEAALFTQALASPDARARFATFPARGR